MRDSQPDAVDRLQLIVANEADREAIRSMLSERYEVVIAEELQAVDCYLVDDRSLPAYREAIEATKAELDPTFQPVLLLRREQATETAPQLGVGNDDDGPPVVDEVVTAPIDRATLYRRLAV